MNTCPPMDEVARLVGGELSPAEQAALITHLRGCPACRRRMADVSWLARAIRSARDMVPSADEPHLTDLEVAAISTHSLEGPRTEVLLRHVGDCGRCAQLVAAVRKALDDFAELFGDDSDTPPSWWSRLIDGIRRAFRSPGTALALLGAAVLLIVGLGLASLAIGLGGAELSRRLPSTVGIGAVWPISALQQTALGMWAGVLACLASTVACRQGAARLWRIASGHVAAGRRGLGAWVVELAVACLIAGVVAGVVAAPPVRDLPEWPRPAYTVTDLGVCLPYAMNDVGQVVGRVNEGTEHDGYSFVWKRQRGRQPVAIREKCWDGLYAINNAGWAVGSSGMQAILWRDGRVEVLPPLEGREAYVQAWGLNDNGQIVGVSSPDGEWSGWVAGARAVLWEEVDGEWQTTEIPPLPAHDHSFATAITNDGLIAGYCLSHSQYDSFPFQWDPINGTRHLVDPPVSGTCSEVRIHREGRTVVGGADSVRDAAFAWDPLNGIRGLEPFPPPSRARDINIRGAIVGHREGFGATLWDREGPKNLNTLIPRRSGWKLLTASAINDRGQIVGWGTLNGQSPYPFEHGFLLTPIRGSAPSK